MTETALLMSGVRTPIGCLSGALSAMTVPQLGAVSIAAALERAGADANQVDEVIMGNVVGAGVGQNPARQASIGAGLPYNVGATTVNKVCGSGLKAVMMATQSVALRESQIVVAGGMESMSQAPYLLDKARQGYRLGNGQLIDSVIHDGLWDCYGNEHMGAYGDQCAADFEFSKQQQDDFAVRSYERALKAQSDGVFAAEIVPVEIAGRKATTVVEQDEEPTRFNEEKLRKLRAAFSADGTITAGNASSINDGAAALVLASEAAGAKLSAKPVARIVGSSTFSREPALFTVAPIGALKKLMDKLDWTVADTDLFEINEAFSAVTLAAQKELELPDDKVNVLGGAVALGHPIGCSGARILVTLLTALRHTGGTRGIACLCIGGGEAVAVAVEVIN